MRQLQRDNGGFGGLEAWIAGRRWKTAPDGWTVTGELKALHKVADRKARHKAGQVAF